MAHRSAHTYLAPIVTRARPVASIVGAMTTVKFVVTIIATIIVVARPVAMLLLV